MSEEATPAQMLGVAAQIVSSYVSRNDVSKADLPELIASVRTALAASGATAGSEATIAKPTATQVRRSITPDALISFEDGKPYKTLRRHLTRCGLTPDAYRAKWSLPADYPMVAETYSAQRSQLAKDLGLGQQRRKTKLAGKSKAPLAA